MYYRSSPNHIFFVNEFWIFIPSAILANYIILRRIRLEKEKIRQLKTLTAKKKFA